MLKDNKKSDRAWGHIDQRQGRIYAIPIFFLETAHLYWSFHVPKPENAAPKRGN
jgi:hypothetical protein